MGQIACKECHKFWDEDGQRCPRCGEVEAIDVPTGITEHRDSVNLRKGVVVAEYSFKVRQNGKYIGKFKCFDEAVEALDNWKSTVARDGGDDAWALLDARANRRAKKSRFAR